MAKCTVMKGPDGSVVPVDDSITQEQAALRDDIVAVGEQFGFLTINYLVQGWISFACALY